MTIYRKFTFPIEKAITPIKRPLCGNGLFNTLYSGYSSHRPILIRADDVLNNVVSVWAKYLVCHAEKFRSQFVEHEGQKCLTYYAGGSYHDSRMEEFLDGLLLLVKSDQKSDNISWAEADFTTTTFTDRMVRAVATLASQKKFYQYGCTLMCGFSEVELAGTEEDWSLLISKINDMPVMDQQVGAWKRALLSVIDQMIEGSEEFWQTCVTEQKYGSGSQKERTGWIAVFNPINERGDWLIQLDSKGQLHATIKESDLLDLTSDFNLHVNDNGAEFDLKIKAGPIQSVEGDKLTVDNLFNISEVVSPEVADA